MTFRNKEYDIFLSYTRHDGAFAKGLQGLLERAGLTTFRLTDAIAQGSPITSNLLHSLAESEAMVIATSGELTNPNVIFEAGMAMAWQMPIFVVYPGESAPNVGVLPSSVRVVPKRDIESLVTSIREASEPLSEAQLEKLRSVYVRTGIPTDRLLTAPASLEALTREFNRIARADVAAPRLLRELIRLRKQKKLPSLKKRSKEER